MATKDGPKALLPKEVKQNREPILCRLCKGQGWYFLPGAEHESQIMACEMCKGHGQLDPADVDEWTFADLDEDLGPGAMGAQRPNRPYVPPNSTWVTFAEGEHGIHNRGLMWCELRAPTCEKK